MISSATIGFLKSLKKNNNKVWFDANREKYSAAKNEFELFISDLLKKIILIDSDLKGLEPKHCTFRINRDIRFSKNKTPYKVSLSASFARGGRKSPFAGYYFHLQPGDNSFTGGGLWMPESPYLKKLRQEIDYCFPEFKKIIHAPAFQKQYKELEKDEKQMLVNLPRGYDKENPAADFLKMKSYVATRNISDAEILAPGLINEAAQSYKAIMPLIKFINRAIE